MTKEEKLQNMTNEYLENTNISISSLIKKYDISRYIFSKHLYKQNIEIRNSNPKSGCKKQCVVDEEFFNIIDTEEKAYWLGFMFADGYVQDFEGRFGVAIHLNDYNHLKKFSQSLKSNVNINVYENVETNYGVTSYCRLIINSRKMVKDLIEHGCVPNKSNILKPPIGVPKELIRHFIRGYFDGDGSYIQGNEKRISFIGTDEVLFFILENLPIEKDKQFAKRKKEHIVSELKFGKKQEVLDTLKYMYLNSNVYLDRKYDLVIENYNKFKELSSTTIR